MIILASILLPMALSFLAYYAAKKSTYIASYISAAALVPLLALSTYVIFGGPPLQEGTLEVLTSSLSKLCLSMEYLSSRRR